MPTTEPQPAPREGLFRRLWGRLTAPELPQATQTAETPPWASPLMPSMLLSREAVSEADRPGAQDRAQRQQHAMARICAINNANVTRDYGTHTADFSRPVRDLAAEELADVLALVKAVYAPR